MLQHTCLILFIGVTLVSCSGNRSASRPVDLLSPESSAATRFPTTTSATVVDAEHEIVDEVAIGELRPLTAGGPEFPLPALYYEHARQHPEFAWSLLSKG